MPRTPKDSITALRPTLEPELLKFVSAASKIFNLQLMPAAMMPPVEEDWVTLSYIHELQRQLNAKVQQEPELTAFFTQLMRKHYEYIKEQGWENRNQQLICYDMASSALMIILGYLRGFDDFRELIATGNEYMVQLVLLNTVLPLTIRPDQTYFHPLLMRIWLAVIKKSGPWPRFNPYSPPREKDALQALTKLLSGLYLFHAGRHGTRLEYKLPDIPTDKSFHATFKTPRFDSITLYPQCLTNATRIPPATEERSWSGMLHMVDNTNMRDMFYLLSESVTNEAEGVKLLTDALKENGQDISHVLFMLWEEVAADQITKAIVDAGANYLIFVNKDALFYRGDRPTIKELRRQHFFGCRHVFTSSKELLAYTTPDVDVDKLLDIDVQNFVFVTSLDLSIDDNAVKLACSLDESWLDLVLKNSEEVLEQGKYDIEECAAQIVELTKLDLSHEMFADFILRQLKNPRELALVQATFDANGITMRAKAKRSTVIEALQEGSLFLHFFGKFMYPLLKRIKEPQ